MSECPNCPRCGNTWCVHEDGDRNWWCTRCKIAFDDTPEEGGDWSTDPTRRIERQEAFAMSREARKAKLNRRTGNRSHRRNRR
jgi:transcription initiation factor TFIIIB Brf1 subunit/transcription initiation factor TFIIB